MLNSQYIQHKNRDTSYFIQALETTMQQGRFPLFKWPWESINNYKYYLYVPLVLMAAHEIWLGGENNDYWVVYVLLVSLLRCLIYQSWHFYSRADFLSRRQQILPLSTDFDQIDREFHWDNYIIFQAWVATLGHLFFPGLNNLPIWNYRGVISVLLLHMGPTELLYYCIHRAFHSGSLFEKYHSLHHASTRPEPSTAGTTSFLEQLVMIPLMAIPILGVVLMGDGSIGMFFVYFLGFDFMKFMIHSNVEVVPLCLFRMIPLLKYLLITPSYHHLHHTKLDSNYCLFMPLYDYLGGTLNEEAFNLHFNMRSQGQKRRAPDLVFLGHGIDFTGLAHIPYCMRTFATRPCSSQWYVWFLMPLIWLGFFVWQWTKTHIISRYTIGEFNQETWAIPRLGFQFYLPSGQDKFNIHIEEAILEADRIGVKVIALAGLNKNEVLNGGGQLFVSKHPNLHTRVVHGNTLTTAVLLHELPHSVDQVFLTGSTSKIGKAIALYLCKKRVRILMLTTSFERFKAVRNQAPAEYQQFLEHVSKYEAGRFCKTWIIGKWAGYKDQMWAPTGTQFYQFTVPKIFEFRKDCTYGDSSALTLPDTAKGVNGCEHSMPRRAIYACHAGGLIHALEGYEHHEVGEIDVDRLDIVWEAAMKHGLRPVSHSKIY